MVNMKKFGVMTFAIIILFILLAGSNYTNELNILRLPNLNPSYIRYSPSERSQMLLEFDYPKTWVFQEEWGSDSGDFYAIAFLDPRGVWDPKKSSHEHCSAIYCGVVAIIMEPLSSDHSLDDHIELIKQARIDSDWMKEVATYQINFHGITAHVLEYQKDYSGNKEPKSMFFDRNVLFQVGNKLYWIMSQIPENERGGEFEKGYEYMLKSMRIIK
jgi:hypothetical protein